MEEETPETPEKIVPPKTKLEEKMNRYYIFFIESDEIIPKSVVNSFLKDISEVDRLKEI